MIYPKALSFAILFTFAGLVNTGAQTFADSLQQQLDQIFEESTFTGLAVSIYTPEKVLYKHSFGYADIANEIKYTSSHIQNIGSVSKTFVAAALMNAVEEGKISLDDPINNYLTFPVVNPLFLDDTITVRHLTTHTSSINDSKFYGKSYVLSEDISEWTEEQKTIKKIKLDKIVEHKKMPLQDYLKAYLLKDGEYFSKSNFSRRPPGYEYKYSNVAAALLAQVIEGAVGEEFNAYSTRVVLKKLGLNDSGWTHDDVDMSQHSILYGSENKPLPKYELNTYPDGGMIASLDDLTTYMMAMMNGYLGEGDFLTTELFKEMMTSQWTLPQFLETDTKGHHSGIIWELNDQHDNLMHNGSDPGTFSLVRFSTMSNLGVAIITNCGIDEEKSRMKTAINLLQTMVNYGKKMNDN